MKNEKLPVSDLRATLSRSAAALVLALMVGWCSAAGAATWRIEAEKAGDGDIEPKFPDPAWRPEPANPAWRPPPTWRVKQAAEAGEGAFLGNSTELLGYEVNGESHPIPTTIPHAGLYRVWVRHYRTPGKPTSFYTLFRDDMEEGAVYQPLDDQPRLQTALASAALPETPKDAKPAFGWSSFEATFERPMNATLSFGPALGIMQGQLGIDCVIVSDDSAFDPQKADWAKLSADPVPLQALTAPRGMKPALPLVMHASFFAGEPDPKNQIRLGVVNATVIYRDSPRLLQLGVNRDHSWINASTKYGIRVMVHPNVSALALSSEFSKSVPAPEGRFVNSEGNVGASEHGLDPARQAGGDRRCQP